MQSETYRKMREVTGDYWEGRYNLYDFLFGSADD